MENRVTSWTSVLLLSLSFIVFSADSHAAERKKPTWLASCPEVSDSNPEITTPKTILLRTPNGPILKLLSKDRLDFVTEPQSVIGCYVNEELIGNSDASPKWQIGSLNRDSDGFYFINGAGIKWRLNLNLETLTFETESGSPGYKPGSGFRFDPSNLIPTDCKSKEYFSRGLNLGFPRNKARVEQFGETKNLIIVVDFADAIFDKDLGETVQNILAPSTVSDFYFLSSNGKLKPNFEIFPKVIRMKSLEKSFSPNTAGSFFVNGQHQPTRLILEAIGAAQLQGELGNYSSLNILAPTALSLGYFGGAFPDTPVEINGKITYNTSLFGGGIGTINSNVPTWKVFAHEYGHLLGMYDYYLPGSSNSGKSPGPFDIMGNTSGSSNSFLGFQRWVQGWYSDAEVICDLDPRSAVVNNLYALNADSGKKLYVHPISSSESLVVELRSESRFDTLSGGDGLLVYTIDMKIDSLSGPIRIQPSEQDLNSNPKNDIDRYKNAPLSSGQYVKVKDFVIFADQVNKVTGSFRIFTSKEFQNKLSLEAKANSQTKKTTITCVKGKLIKKVTAVKPVCPKGYKKK
jgi:hypothetical protein